LKCIIISVASNGDTQVETRGFSGSECREASRFIEQALGQRTHEQLTSECYSTQSQQQQQREGQ
jgi:hypothetical protein